MASGPYPAAYMAYWMAHIGKSLLWAASDLITLYTLVTLYAVDPLVAGAMFLAALTANAVADMGVGVWLDRHPAHGAPLAGAALLISALAFPATMLAAPLGSGALVVAMLIFRVAYAGYDVPHNALMTQLAPDAGRAAWLSRGRTIGTGIAAFTVAASAADAVDPGRIALFLWTLSIAAAVLGSLLIPLLRRIPFVSPLQQGKAGLSLPIHFLAASVIGIVALGALAKSVLHLPPAAARIDSSHMLLLLTAGRTVSALLPFRIAGAQRGLMLLTMAYLVAAGIAAAFAWTTAAPMLVALGLAMGFTNLVGWALLPSLARGARGYGLYAMVSKLALGAAGLALAGGLGRAPAFAPGAFAPFALAVALGCVAAAALAAPGLTLWRSRAFAAR